MQIADAFAVTAGPAPVVETAIHAGHDVRPDLAELMALDEVTRRREEDPYTDLLLSGHGTRIVVHRSRFEVDLNRPRDAAVYLEPDDAWGLDVWNDRPAPEAVRTSLAIYDDFYRQLADHLDRVTATGPALVLDVHSYNHRRQGPDRPAAPDAENPEVNVGTGALDRDRWAPVVETFIAHLGGQTVAGRRVDVRENVRFRGGQLSRWVAERYADTACALAIEFKKTFMDEWTDTPDDRHIDQLAAALASTVEHTAEAIVTGSR